LLANLKNHPSLDCLLDKNWRIRNLYWIKDKEGNQVKFKPNWAQEVLLNDPHPCKIILKARQLGITTFCSIDSLDDVLFSNNIHAGVIAHTLDDSQNIFSDKLKFAFDHLDPRMRALFRTIGDSAKELSFTNGSLIRVGTSLRSATLQRLHISEFGKICCKNPEKAKEIITGSLNTVQAGQKITIESTAEGREGHFYSMCQRSMNNSDNLSPLDFKFFFFPWHLHFEYVMDTPQEAPDHLKDYFAKLSLEGIELTDPQKNWYVAKWQTQQEDMLREFPSTAEEAFAVSQEGNWYSRQIKELYDTGHVTTISCDKSQLVHTAWDLGQADKLAIWFFQINRVGEIMIIDYFDKTDFGINEMIALLQSKGYTYGTHIWPHDANARDRSGITFASQARQLGINGIILPQQSVADGINIVRSTFSKCWFDKVKCKDGLNALENYKKRWNSTIGGYTGEPLHDANSNGADAFRYLCCGISKVQASFGSVSNDYAALRKYWGG
jgi:hypothetical protein